MRERELVFFRTKCSTVGWAGLIKPNIGDGIDAVWDAAENLETIEDMAAYLEAAPDVGDAALIGAALGDIARAKA